MLTRRRLLKSAGASGLVLGASGLASPLIAQGTTVKIGYVSPQTGPLAGSPRRMRSPSRCSPAWPPSRGWTCR